MEDIYYVLDLKNNILNMGQLLEKGYSIFMKNQIFHLKDKNGWVFTHVEMTKNQLNLKRKTLALKHEGKVEDAEKFLKKSKALEAHMVEIEYANNKAYVVTHMMKDEFFNRPIDGKIDVVIFGRGYAWLDTEINAY